MELEKLVVEFQFYKSGSLHYKASHDLKSYYFSIPIFDIDGHDKLKNSDTGTAFKKYIDKAMSKGELKLIELRPATFNDWQMLLEWRNDKETRKNSLNMDIVPEENHKKWLTSVLNNPDRKLFIAEVNSIPIGTIRIDKEDNSSELSWTIAPDHRGNGYGKQMLQNALKLVQGKAVATIKKFNTPSIRIAESVGMKLSKEQDDILVFEL